MIITLDKLGGVLDGMITSLSIDLNETRLVEEFNKTILPSMITQMDTEVNK